MNSWKDHGAGTFLLEYFNNSVNDVNIALAIKNRQKFEDFFLSSENGSPLNRMQQVSVDSCRPSLFTQCPQQFSTIFSFNSDLQLGNYIKTAYQ